MRVDNNNSSVKLWFSEPNELWHWVLYFSPNSEEEYHFNGNAPTDTKAQADIDDTLSFIERTYPTEEFFSSQP